MTRLLFFALVFLFVFKGALYAGGMPGYSSTVYIGLNVYKVDDGFVVYRVGKGSAGDRSGIKIRDIITSIDGKTFESSLHMNKYTTSRTIDTTISVKLKRDGKEKQINVLLDRFMEIKPEQTWEFRDRNGNLKSVDKGNTKTKTVKLHRNPKITNPVHTKLEAETSLLEKSSPEKDQEKDKIKDVSDSTSSETKKTAPVSTTTKNEIRSEIEKDGLIESGSSNWQHIVEPIKTNLLEYLEGSLSETKSSDEIQEVAINKKKHSDSISSTKMPTETKTISETRLNFNSWYLVFPIFLGLTFAGWRIARKFIY